MSKKAKFYGGSGSTRAERELSNMKHKDLKRACIARGLGFEEAVNFSIPQLAGWFCKHHDFSQNHLLLNEFDAWRDMIYQKAGHEKDSYVFHPALRLGFIGKMDEEGTVTSTKKPRLKGLEKPKKLKRERLQGTGVFTGTKKGLTYQLTKEGKKINEIIEAVMAQFPDALEKSIKIWSQRCLKGK